MISSPPPQTSELYTCGIDFTNIHLCSTLDSASSDMTLLSDSFSKLRISFDEDSIFDFFFFIIIFVFIFFIVDIILGDMFLVVCSKFVFESCVNFSCNVRICDFSLIFSSSNILALTSSVTPVTSEPELDIVSLLTAITNIWILSFLSTILERLNVLKKN